MDSPPAGTRNGAPEPTIADLVGQVVADAEALIRGEVALAKAEIRAEIVNAREGLVALAVGGVVLAVGGLMLVIMVAHVLTDLLGVTPWGSYLIVGTVLTASGALLLRQAQQRMTRVDPVPHATIDSVRKDLEWIRQQTPSAKT